MIQFKEIIITKKSKFSRKITSIWNKITIDDKKIIRIFIEEYVFYIATDDGKQN